MICPQCESGNTKIQITTETEICNDDRGVLGTVLWILALILWCAIVLLVYSNMFLLVVPPVLFIISGQKKKNITQKHIAVCVCQDCGHGWKIHQI